jgi:tRNA (guanine10-N2)-dimethyltransferase
VRLLVELSGEHEGLARAELEAVAELAGGRVHEWDGAVALVDVPDEGAPAQFLLSRLALAHSVSAHWWTTAATPRTMLPPFSRVNLEGASFAIRAKRVGGAHPDLPLSDTVRAAGAQLAEEGRGRVDLKAPQLEIRMVVSNDAHVGAHLGEVDRAAFEARHPKHRPHFAPVSIHPKYARALVNMARVRAGDLVADPFCGTGGQLLEAGLVGARVLGGDLDPRMVAGTREMLVAAGVRDVRVEARDVGELPDFAGEKVDVVISDPPYGRSSTTNREEMDALYDRFFHAAREALKPGGRLAIITPSAVLRERAAALFRMVESHDQHVHKSMTRHWAVLVRE